MDQSSVPPRGRSFIGPVILICIGVFFLVANLVPSFDPWEVMSKYWPVILILIGVGKVWDYYAVRRYPAMTGGSGATGLIIAVVLLMLLLGLGVWHSERRITYTTKRDTQTVDLGGATAVTANLQFPAGQLNVKGGSGHLLDADFTHDDSASAPQLSYSVNGGHGDLSLSDNGNRHRYGSGDYQWDLALNDAVPFDLTVQIGAGQSDLQLADVNLTHLQVHVGAGELTLDLTGPRKQNLSADIQGGVGQARIKLPKDVGVRAQAHGGIGSVNVHGLTTQGDAYVNDVYGKTPTSIELTVQGGIGEIDLDQE